MHSLHSFCRSSVFNVFKSAIAYDTSIKTLPNIAKDGGEEQMVEYEFEPDTKEEVMQVTDRHETAHPPAFATVDMMGSLPLGTRTLLLNASRLTRQANRRV